MDRIIDKLSSQLPGQYSEWIYNGLAGHTSSDDARLVAILLADGSRSPSLNLNDWWSVIQCVQRVSLIVVRSPETELTLRLRNRLVLGFLYNHLQSIALIGDRSTNGTEMSFVEDQAEQDGVIAKVTLATRLGTLGASGEFQLSDLIYVGETPHAVDWIPASQVMGDPWNARQWSDVFDPARGYHLDSAAEALPVVVPLVVAQLSAHFTRINDAGKVGDYRETLIGDNLLGPLISFNQYPSDMAWTVGVISYLRHKGLILPFTPDAEPGGRMLGAGQSAVVDLFALSEYEPTLVHILLKTYRV